MVFTRCFATQSPNLGCMDLMRKIWVRIVILLVYAPFNYLVVYMLELTATASELVLRNPRFVIISEFSIPGEAALMEMAQSKGCSRTF